jgi:DNA-binding transcriptional ArsR family regulator
MGITRTDLYREEQVIMSQLFKVLGHPARIAILQHLSSCKSCITGDIVEEIGLAQPTISQHLKELKAIGIIQGSVEGTSVCYCINPEKWDEIGALVSALFSEHHPKNQCC